MADLQTFPDGVKPQQRPRLSKRQSSEGITEQPRKPQLRETTTVFADDVLAKQRATDRHNIRRQFQENNGASAEQQQPTPGPVHVGGTMASYSSDKDEDPHENNLLTAIPVKADEEGGIDEVEKQQIEEKAKMNIKRKMFSEAVEAEVADVDGEETRRKRKNCIVCWSIVACFLLGGIGVGVAVAFSLSPKETPSEAPTPALSTSSPTAKPPIFMTPPNLNETDDPDTADLFLDNSVCEGAYDIASTIGESFFGNMTLARVAPVDTCEVIFRNGVGVWYKFQGDGSRYFASTCDGNSFDTQLSVYSGVCGKLRCVAGNDQMELCGNGDQSMLGFATETNVFYYIYMQARRRQSQQLFQLLVDNLDGNDDCENAVPLIPDGPRLFGSTRGAPKVDDSVECSDTVFNSPAIWYKVVGQSTGHFCGDQFEVDVYSSNTAFSPQYQIFVEGGGGGCGSLTCWSRSRRFDVLPGVTYYIVVFGSSEDEEGDFQISIGIYDCTAAGHYVEVHDCDNPQWLFSGGSDISATPFQRKPDFGSCGNLVFATSRGVFYRVEGTGGPLTVSTCDSTDRFDTQISVLEGPCDDLVCIDGNDQACGDHSSVSWFSEFGVIYSIVVHGYAAHEGRFEISLEESTIDVGEICEEALDAYPDGLSVLGSTKNITAATTVTACGDIQAGGAGVWYKIQAEAGKSLTASTCINLEGTSHTRIAVFSGECGSLNCVDALIVPCGNHHSLTWLATEAKYYLYIEAQVSFGLSGTTFSFRTTFSFYVEETTTNDLCDDAVGPLASDGSPTFGSTRSATVDDSTVSILTRGVWYYVLGTGTTMNVTTCSQYTDLQTSLSIFQGNDCIHLVPVETTTTIGCLDDFGFNLSWDSVEGDIYYLIVAGDELEDFGNFALSIISAE